MGENIIRESSSPTTQALIFTILGHYCLDSNPPMSTASYIDVLARAGISAHATRLTLSRMAERGFLHRHRMGRAAYWTGTEVGLEVVRGQQLRTFTGTQPAWDDDEVWTVLSFSIPESRRRDRDLLRRRLEWEGFGLLRDGVWIAPGDRNLDSVLNLDTVDGVGQFVDAFRAYPHTTDIKDMIARTWNLSELRERYDEFLAEWDTPARPQAAEDALGRILLLITCWRQLVRETPRLPEKYLPAGWSARRCGELFRVLVEKDEQEARNIFRTIADTSAVGALL